MGLQNGSALYISDLVVNDANWVLRENVSEKECREYYEKWDSECGGGTCPCHLQELDERQKTGRQIQVHETKHLAGSRLHAAWRPRRLIPPNGSNCPSSKRVQMHPHCSEPVRPYSCCSQMCAVYLAEQQVSAERVYPVR